MKQITRAEASLGEFEQLVLLALVRLGPEAYGATIRREIEARTGRDLARVWPSSLEASLSIATVSR